MKSTPRSINYEFQVFKALCITMILVGHLGTTGFKGPYDLFTPYSYHVAAFAFIAGYFFHSLSLSDLPSFALKKAKRLLLPALLINIVYGVICVELYKRGFHWEDGHTNATLSFETLVLAPFFDGHQFNLNYSMWFLPSLFFAELGFALVYALLSHIATARTADWAVPLVALVGGAVAIHTGGSEGLEAGPLLLANRASFLACFIGVGLVFRNCVEQKLAGRELQVCILTCCAQVVFTYLTKGYLIYSVAWANYTQGPLLVIAFTITGIGFWLMLSKLLAPALEGNKLVDLVANNTYSLMLHHRLGYFLLTCLLGLSALVTPFNHGFDWVAFKTSESYTFFPQGLPQFAFVYLLVGFMVPLAIHALWERAKALIVR